MIQPLRATHYRVFFVLGFALPVLFVAGLSVRHSSAVESVATPENLGYHLVSSDSGQWQSLQIGLRFYSRVADSSQSWVQFVPEQEVLEPTLLVYWSSSKPLATSLPTEARLMGPFAPRNLLPMPDKTADGFLILYSLGHHAAIDATFVRGRP
jgi:hypothetical protein